MLFLADRQERRGMMMVKYFSDTDTAYIDFTDSPVQETNEISDNSMTIQFAKSNAMLSDFSLEEISAKST